MREPTVHALGSVLESKKATAPNYGEARTIRLRPAAAATTMADSSASLRFDSDRYRSERVIEIKSESVITFVGIRKQRKSRCEKRGENCGGAGELFWWAC
jgi:hypothetical protein